MVSALEAWRGRCRVGGSEVEAHGADLLGSSALAGLGVSGAGKGDVGNGGALGAVGELEDAGGARFSQRLALALAHAHRCLEAPLMDLLP